MTQDGTPEPFDDGEKVPLSAYENDAEAWAELEADLPAPGGHKIVGNPIPHNDGHSHTSWWPVDLGPILDGTAELPVPTIGTRTDGLPLLYPAKCHAYNGESESGKSWAASLAAAEEINAGNDVWYCDFEDTALTLTARMLALGAKPEALVAHLHYIAPHDTLIYKNTPQPALADLLEGLDRWPPTLVVVDGVTEAMSMHGLDLNSNQDYAVFHNMLPARCARLGAAVVNIDHVTKDREGRGRWAIGAQHKLAGMDGAVFGFEVSRPFGLGLHGVARLVIQKDRPGQLRRHAKGKGVIAEFHMDSSPETHALKAYMLPPPSDAELGEMRDVALMERVSAWLAAHPGEHSRSEVRRNVKGGNDAVLGAIDALSPAHAVTRRSGNAVLVAHLKLFRAYNDE